MDLRLDDDVLDRIDEIVPRNVSRSWYSLRDRAGLGPVRFHDLRHSCASFLIAAGASPRTVMKTLGHSQISLTMNTYAHVLPEVERAAVDAAAQVIFGAQPDAGEA
jgi:integrase